MFVQFTILTMVLWISNDVWAVYGVVVDTESLCLVCGLSVSERWSNLQFEAMQNPFEAVGNLNTANVYQYTAIKSTHPNTNTTTSRYCSLAVPS